MNDILTFLTHGLILRLICRLKEMPVQVAYEHSDSRVTQPKNALIQKFKINAI